MPVDRKRSFIRAGLVLALGFIALFACTDSARRLVAPPEAPDLNRLHQGRDRDRDHEVERALALQRIDSLEKTIKVFQRSGDIKSKPARELDDLLDDIASDLGREKGHHGKDRHNKNYHGKPHHDDFSHAIARLNDFIRFVELEVKKKAISKQAGAALKEAAREIIAILEGNVPLPDNVPPSVEIATPADSATFASGAPIAFDGTANDPEDGTLADSSLVWTSSIDGQIGIGTTFTRSDLSAGTHTIVLTATDSAGALGADTIHITISSGDTPRPPTAQITAPTDTARFTFGDSIVFVGVGLTGNGQPLTDSSLVWTSSVAGRIGTGVTFVRTDLAVGTHTITLIVTDANHLADTASIQITIQPATPANQPPTVDITSPASGAAFVRLVDPLIFQATATDPEDGPLTGGSIVWSSSLDGPIGTGATLNRNNLTLGTHLVTVTATDASGATATDTVTILLDGGHISVPGTLNVPYTRTASLPIQLVAPAPPGGAALTIVSSDPTHVTVLTPSVTIPEGQLAANATLSGTMLGPSTVSVSADHYGTGISEVVTSATVNIVDESATLTTLIPDTITLRLESGGQPVAAPPGGVTVTLTSNNPACVTPASNLFVPEGQAQTSSILTYGGTASIPCTATIRSNAPSFTSDSVTATVSDAPTLGIAAAPVVGVGLQVQSVISGLPSPRPVVITATSNNPSLFLVSPNTSTPGAASVTFTVGANNNGIVTIQALEGGTGTGTLTLSAPGFISGTVTVNVVQPALEVSGLTLNNTTKAGDDEFIVNVGISLNNGGSVGGTQSIRPGGVPLTATVTTSDSTVGRLLTNADTGASVTVQIQPGSSNSPSFVGGGGIAFDPIGAGSTTISATIPGFIATTASSQTVNLVAPTLTVSPTSVGSGLQQQVSFFGLPSGHPVDTITVTSSDPSVLLVSPNATTAGSASTTIIVPSSNVNSAFFIQGVEGQTGTATVTITGPGYNPGQAVMTVLQPAVGILSINLTPTTQSGDQPVVAIVGLPGGTGGNAVIIGSGQAVRAGGVPLALTFASSNPTVGTMVTSAAADSAVTIQIQPGQNVTQSSVSQGGVAFRPINGGTTTVAATIPGFIQTTSASRTVNVSAATITLQSDTVLGRGLQTQVSVFLPGGHPAVTLTLTSTNPNILLVAPNAQSNGAPTGTLTVPANGNNFSFIVQALEGVLDTASIAVSATGYATATRRFIVVQPAFVLGDLVSSTTTQSPNDIFTVRVGIPNAANTNILGGGQAVRFGGVALPVRVTSSNAFVGQLVTTATTGAEVTVLIQPGQATTSSGAAAGGVDFDPVGFGSTTVSATIPGLIATTGATQTVQVVAPQIAMSTATVGAGLQTGSNFFLVEGHPPVTVTVTSSNPSILLVSPNTNTPGSASIQITVTSGGANVGYVVQGVEGAVGTATVTASAPGYTNGTALMTVVTPAIDILNLETTTTAGSADNAFTVRIGTPTTGTPTQIAVAQSVRVGGTGFTITVNSSNGEVGQLVTTAATGTTATVQITPGQATSPASVAQGGVAFHPLSAGNTTVTATAPGVVSAALATRVVTVNASP